MLPITSLPTGWAAAFWGVITFSLLVFLHEGGHFLAARAFKVRVHEFMLGLPGPGLRWRSKRSGTAYGVTMVPLGGYCRIAGMEPGPEDPLLADALALLMTRNSLTAEDLSAALHVTAGRATSLLMTLVDYAAATTDGASDSYVATVTRGEKEDAPAVLDRLRASTYRGVAVWKRITILGMGIIVNIVAAIVILTTALTAVGIPTATTTVAEVAKGSPAAAAGIMSGDTVVGIGSVTVNSWPDLRAYLAKAAPGTPLDVRVMREGGPLTISVVPTASPSGGALLGVTAKEIDVPQPFTVALRQSLSMTGQVFVAVAQFFEPSKFAKSVSNARSIVGVSYEVASAAAQGPLQYAWMIALLSLSLGAMNLLPLPPLDGGKIAVEIVEKLLRRQIPRAISLAISAVGTLLLFSLIFYLMYADVLRYIVNKG